VRRREGETRVLAYKGSLFFILTLKSKLRFSPCNLLDITIRLLIFKYLNVGSLLLWVNNFSLLLYFYLQVFSFVEVVIFKKYIKIIFYYFF
jgi:hypothetical protein